ncbi:MAG: hypothetical protein LQ338_006239 [Usnochroma carphineum]|nr:MAG: hypothetical protein LQ338_006239 [Usnochroma carphineum]
MANLGRNRTMPTDAAVSKFLYTIMRQLDLKSIDWNAVATELEITNGHAARMRYSRFKQQMEGTATTTRKSKAATPRKRKEKPENAAKPEKKRQKKDDSEAKNGDVEESTAMAGAESTAAVPQYNGASDLTGVKAEPTMTVVKAEPVAKAETIIKPEPYVKEESLDPAMKPEPFLKQASVLAALQSYPVAQPDTAETDPEPLPDFFSTEEELQATKEHEKSILGSVKQEPETKVKMELEQ